MNHKNYFLMEQKRNNKLLFFSLILISVFGFLSFVGQNAYANQTTLSLTTTIIEEAKLTASDAEQWDKFGSIVSMSNDTIVVGAPYEDGPGISRGAVYVYKRNQVEPGSWVEVTKLISPDNEDNGFFGRSAAVCEDTIIVGGLLRNDLGEFHGYAYIFERNQGGIENWGIVKKITKPDINGLDSFGLSVAINENTIVIGDPTDNTSAEKSGSAYIYDRNQGGQNNWGEVAKLFASDGEESDYFGHSVSVNGNTIIVGAWGEDGSGTDRGAAYIFERNEGGENHWGERVKLTASESEDKDFFGFTTAIDNQTIVVGAFREYEQGSAYVFDRNEGGLGNWGVVARLVASDAENVDYYASNVTIDQDIIAVGSAGEDGIGSNRGAVYIYGRDLEGNNSWGELTKLTASDPEDEDLFGISVAIDNNGLAVGAVFEGDLLTRPGAVYVYRLLQGYNVFLPLVKRNN